MKRRLLFPAWLLALAPVLILARPAMARPGTVTWSDGRQMTGDLTLTPGKQLKLFTSGSPVEFPLAEVKEIRFTPEKEQMAEGFYFPNAGQATQAKTGDVYPTRQLRAQFTMSDGRVLEGHLFTTVLYVQGRRFHAKGHSRGEADRRRRPEARRSPLPGPHSIRRRLVQFLPTRPEPPQIRETAGRPLAARSRARDPRAGWGTRDLDDAHARPGEARVFARRDERRPGRVAGPGGRSRLGRRRSERPCARCRISTTRARLLGTFAEGEDVYSLVMMSRQATTYSMNAGTTPWSLVVLHWNVDAGTHKATLLNRGSFALGRAGDDTAPPPVAKDAALLHDVTAATGATP